MDELLGLVKVIPVRISQSRNAKVWIGELPNALYDPISTLEAEVRALTRSSHSSCAVELVHYRGPHVLYGLLGAEFRAEPSPGLRIRVGTTEEEGKVFADSLAPKDDIVRVGLPKEYAGVVFGEFVRTQAENPQIGSGLLTVSCAAHGRVTSAEFIFRQLAKVVLRLLGFTKSDISPDNLLSLFKDRSRS